MFTPLTYLIKLTTCAKCGKSACGKSDEQREESDYAAYNLRCHLLSFGLSRWRDKGLVAGCYAVERPIRMPNATAKIRHVSKVFEREIVLTIRHQAWQCGAVSAQRIQHEKCVCSNVPSGAVRIAV